MSETTDPFMDIEIFPCAGGMAEGFRLAGVEFDLAIELMENHCDSYEANLGHRPVQMDARSFLYMLQDGWRPPKPVRMLVADPPCTPWSRAGKRMGQDDPRDMLDGTCRIIALLKPMVYLIGNVPGLDDGPNLHIVQRTIGDLAKHGYCTADFSRLNAANYGTPQHRHRPFWFGHQEGPCIRWPAPTHGDPDGAAQPGQLTVAGVTPLIPWITCKQALGHLSMEELGRPIKLRRRNQNSLQHGSVEERPARVVGTSNLSDGNVLLPPDAPRAGKRGKPKNHGTPQGQRVTPTDHAAPTLTQAQHTILEIRTTPPAPLELVHPGIPASTYRARDDHRVRQGDRTNDPNKPSAVVTTKPSRARAGAHAVLDVSEFTIQERRGGKNGLNRADQPSKAIVRNTHGNGSVIVTDKHPSMTSDAPALTIRGGGEGHSAPPFILENDKRSNAQLHAPAQRQAQVLSYKANHPPSRSDEPAMTQRASSGGGATRALEWPWDRPSTTVLADERLGPPGHHDEDYAVMSTTGDGIVISEKAASILQGFPQTITCACGWRRATPWENEVKAGDACPTCLQAVVITDWIFIGETKKERWSQIGQAMPPTLAYPVAAAVVEQIEKSQYERVEKLAASCSR